MRVLAIVWMVWEMVSRMGPGSLIGGNHPLPSLVGEDAWMGRERVLRCCNGDGRGEMKGRRVGQRRR